jgi:hypothetical protein
MLDDVVGIVVCTIVAVCALVGVDVGAIEGSDTVRIVGLGAESVFVVAVVVDTKLVVEYFGRLVTLGVDEIEFVCVGCHIDAVGGLLVVGIAAGAVAITPAVDVVSAGAIVAVDVVAVVA